MVESAAVGIVAAVMAPAVQGRTGGRIDKQHSENIIPGSDGLAGIIGQIILDLQGVGTGTVGIVRHHRLLGQDCHIVGVSAVPLEGQSAIVRQQIADDPIQCPVIKGSRRIAAQNIPHTAQKQSGSKIPVKPGRGSVDQLIFPYYHRSCGHRHGSRIRSGGHRSIRRSGGSLRLIVAGNQRQHHCQSKQ